MAFCHLQKTFGDKYGKQLTNTATRKWINTAKTASKRVVQKTAEATEDLIGNKIADKITSLVKQRGRKKKKKNKESTYHQKNDSKLLMT